MKNSGKHLTFPHDNKSIRKRVLSFLPDMEVNGWPQTAI